MKYPRHVFILMAVFSVVAHADESRWKVELLPGDVRVEGMFTGELDISGLASVDGTHCLAVSDETKGGQGAQMCEFSREEAVIKVGGLLPLTKKETKVELDLEGVTVDSANLFYYATGSHGVSKSKGKLDEDRLHVFRIPIDPKSMLPRKDGIKSASLIEALRRDATLGSSVGQSLQKGGLNIEGLAFKAGSLFFGVRSPNIDGRIFVIETDADKLYASKTPKIMVHALPLEPRRGIRELVALSDGFLLLIGNSASEPSEATSKSTEDDDDKGFSLYHWRPSIPSIVEKVGDLTDVKNKGEGLLLLGETAAAIDVMVIFDGADNGAPVIYRLNRPQ